MWKTKTLHRPHKRVAELDDAIGIDGKVLLPRDPIADPEPEAESEIGDIDEFEEMEFDG